MAAARFVAKPIAAPITDIQSALAAAAGDRWRLDTAGGNAARLTHLQSGTVFGLTFTEEKPLRTVVAAEASSRSDGMLLIPLLSVVRANAQAAVRERESIGL